MERGFSLLEVVLVLALVAILSVIATLNFRAYLLRYRSEAQTRFIFGELQKARVDAVCRGKGVRVKFYPASFEVYSSRADNAGGARPVLTRKLSFPITTSYGITSAGFLLDFDQVGIASDRFSICQEPEGTGAVDSIKIYETRLSIGKKDSGHDCRAEYITVR